VDFELPAPAIGLTPTRITFYLETTEGLPARAAIEAYNFVAGKYDTILGKRLDRPARAAKPKPAKPGKKSKRRPRGGRRPKPRSAGARTLALEAEVATVPLTSQELDLPDPADHMEPRRGRVRLRVTLEATGQRAKTGAGGRRLPRIEAFDIEIEGNRP
jgi:hypothetical protein